MGGLPHVPVTDDNGFYNDWVNSGWSGTVTPALAGYTFSPTNLSYTNVVANQTTQNYTGSAITYTISGNAGVAGATLSYTDGSAKTATSASDGSYSFAVSYNWNGTITPALTGYTFSPTDLDYSTTPVIADLTGQDFSATLNTYTLNYNAGDGGTISGTASQTVNYGSDGTAVTAVPSTGYHFVSWSDGILTASRTDTDVTANISVTANFAINTYTLTYTAGANGSISGTTPQTVNYGANGTAVTAMPDAGYHFVSWSDGLLTASRTDTGVAADLSVTANFAINSYTLSYTAGSNGSITGTPSQTVNYGATGTAVTGVPNAGYHFVNWSDGSTANPRTDTNVTANVSVTANFTSSFAPANGAILTSLRPVFDWPDTPGAASYNIQVSKNNTFSSLVVNKTVTPSTYTPTANLPTEIQLYWRVRAKIGSAYGAWSAPLSFIITTSPTVTKLLAPANNALTTNYTPWFDWTNSAIPAWTAFDHYEIQIATNSTFSSIVVDGVTAAGDITASSYTPASNLPPNTKFFWRVRSFNTSGQYSAWSAVRTLRTALLPPTLVSPGNDATGVGLRPTFSWSNPNAGGVTGYTIQVSKNSTFTALVVNKTLSGVATTTFTPPANLPTGITPYYWRVRVNGANGPSVWSVGSFTP